jgi:hypothetical protein
VPTFCHDELLRDVPGLDTWCATTARKPWWRCSIRSPRGEPPRNISGLVWREGERIVKGSVRLAPKSLDHLPVPERSAEPYLVGGITVDFLITARGCVGECNYCSIAAYTSEQSRPFRLRGPEAGRGRDRPAVPERGARVMFVQDDLFVLPSEKKCVERVDAMAAALEREGVSDVRFLGKGPAGNHHRPSVPSAEAARDDPHVPRRRKRVGAAARLPGTHTPANPQPERDRALSP